MSGNQTELTWRAELVARYPALFHQEFNGRVTMPNCSVGDGWRGFVETAIGRIAAADAAAPAGSLKIGQIEKKFGNLRLYPDGRVGLPELNGAAIDEAICRAEARSACSCETCGAKGRLFKRSGSFMTACDERAKGKPVRERPGLENLHITHAVVDDKRVVRARRYIRATDSLEEA